MLNDEYGRESAANATQSPASARSGIVMQRSTACPHPILPRHNQGLFLRPLSRLVRTWRHASRAIESFRIVCQTITWKETQRDHFEEIFPAIAACGCDGVEIGVRHIQPIDPKKLRDMLRRCGLELAVVQAGDDLEDPSPANPQKRVIDELIEYMAA